jgi:hypothetical protein
MLSSFLNHTQKSRIKKMTIIARTADNHIDIDIDPTNPAAFPGLIADVDLELEELESRRQELLAERRGYVAGIV